MEKKETPSAQRRSERLGAALEAAEEAFWEAIARRYPECKTGDLDPESQIRFSQAAKAAAEAWVEANEPKRIPGPQM